MKLICCVRNVKMVRKVDGLACLTPTASQTLFRESQGVQDLCKHERTTLITRGVAQDFFQKSFFRILQLFFEAKQEVRKLFTEKEIESII